MLRDAAKSSVRRRARPNPVLSVKRKNTFSLPNEEEENEENSYRIPQDLLPEKGWITPASRKLGKRAKINGPVLPSTDQVFSTGL